jgi:hypothetical protein
MSKQRQDFSQCCANWQREHRRTNNPLLKPWL